MVHSLCRQCFILICSDFLMIFQLCGDIVESIFNVDIKSIFSSSETYHHTHPDLDAHKDFGRISSSLFYVKTGFFPSDSNFLNPPLSMQIPLSFYLYQYP